jgi:hypothetical protein
LTPPLELSVPSGTIPGGIEPMSVAVHLSGKFAYVGDVVTDDVLIYSVDTTTGP